MNKKLAIRTGIGLGAIAILVTAYMTFSSYSLDPEFGKKHDTAGYIAALENKDQGTQAVLFNPGGEKIDSAGYRPGAMDRELTWSKDGSHIFISSNRGASSFGIFRWTPTTNSIESRSLGDQSQSALNFSTDDVEDKQQSGLLVSGGKVFVYEPRVKGLTLLLTAVFDPRGGASRDSVIDGSSSQVGTGFKEAYWTKDRQALYTVMLQEDGTEALVVHYMGADEKGNPRPPYPVFMADKMQIQVGKSGRALVAAQNFRFRGQDWPTPPPDQKALDVLENKNALLYVDLDEALTPAWQPLIITPDKKQVLWDIAMSPSDEEFAVIAGELTNGQDFYPKMLVLSPMRPPSPENPPALVPILEGPFSRPRWSPDGEKLVMLRDEADGKRSVVRMNKDGSDVTRLSKEGVDYELAVFSPQIPGG